MKRGQLKDLVENALKSDERTRNDDKILVMSVWWAMDRTKFSTDMVEGRIRRLVAVEDVIDFFPKSDEVTRIRRRFQEKGLYPSTDPVIIARRRKDEKNWRGFAKTGEFDN